MTVDELFDNCWAEVGGSSTDYGLWKEVFKEKVSPYLNYSLVQRDKDEQEFEVSIAYREWMASRRQ
jgi:hypothetical protein